MRRRFVTVLVTLIILVASAPSMLLAASDGGCVAKNFLQDFTSGSVVAGTESGTFVLELEVGPTTVYVEESPGTRAGILPTERYVDNFSRSSHTPNTTLSLGTSGAMSVVAFRLDAAEFVDGGGRVRYHATALETTASADPESSVVLGEIAALAPEFGSGWLWIDAFELCVCPLGMCLNQAGPGCCTSGDLNCSCDGC